MTYISGPITGIKDYSERFAQAETALAKQGHTVINPAKVLSLLPDGLSHSEYMVISMALLSLCDTICMIDGWADSKGAKQEFLWAANNGLAVDMSALG